VKVELTNGERVELLKYVNREIQKVTGASGTVARFTKLYELQAKLSKT